MNKLFRILFGGILALVFLNHTYGQISVTTQQFCGPAALNLSASGPNQDDFKWYSSANGGPSLATGPNYTTPAITYSQSYFVADPHMSTTEANCNLFYWYDDPANPPVGSGCNYTETGDVIQSIYYVQDSTLALNAIVGYAPGDLAGETTNWTTNNMDERYAVKFDAHQSFKLNSIELKINYPAWDFCGQPQVGNPARLFDVELLQNNNVIQSVQPTVSCGTGTMIVTVDLGFQITQGTGYKLRLTNLQNASNQYIVLNYQAGADYTNGGALDNAFIHMTGYGDDGNPAAVSSYGGLYNWDITAGEIIEVHNPRTLVYVQDTCNVLCGDSIDLNTWVQGGISSAGNWTVTPDGTSVQQSINAPGPSFFVSSEEYINVELTGSFIVNDVGDNDFAGFVFGYQHPLAVADTQQFYLFDWKKQAQGGGAEGFNLIQVNDTRDLSTINHLTNAADYWDHVSTANFNVLQSNTGPGTGWVAGQLYHFTFTYTSARAVIVVDGGVYSNDTIIDIGGCFNSGRFGFYNFSQADVTYSDFTYKLTADYDLITPSICVTDSGEFVSIDLTSSECNGSVVENNIVNWAWDMGDGTTYTHENVIHKYDSSGAYDVFLEVEDSIGCTANVSKQIIVNNALNVDLSAPISAICQGNNTTIHASPNTGASYEWFRNGGSLGAAALNDSVLTVTQAGDYYAIISHPSACGNISDTITIITSALPTGNITPTDDVCANSSATYTATHFSGGQYNWTITNADSTTTDSNSAIVYFNTASVNLEVIITDSNGCSSLPIQETINALASPVPLINGDTSACVGDTISLNTTTSLGNTYSWYTNDAFISTANPDTRTIAISDSILWVQLVEENGIGCKDSIRISLYPLSIPNGSLSEDTIVCSGASVSSEFYFSGNAPFTFDYVSSNNGPLTVSNHPDSVFNITVNTSDTIILTSVVDANRCSAIGLPDSLIISINSTPDTLNFTDSCISATEFQISFGLTSGDTVTYSIQGENGTFTNSNNWISDPIPEGSSYSIVVSDTNSCSPITISGTVNCACPISPEAGTTVQICPGDSAQLSASGGIIYNWESNSTLSNDTISDPTVFPLVDTYYHVQIENAGGCIGEDSVLVQVHDSLKLTISPDTSICKNETLEVSVSGGNTYTWSPANSLSSTTGSTTTFEDTVSTTLYVNGIDNNNCTAMDSLSISINPLPNIQTSPDTNLCLGNSVEISATGGSNYVWSPSTGLSVINTSNTVFNGTTSTLYTVIGTDANGCSNQDLIQLTVNSIPTIEVFDDSTICLGDAISTTYNTTYDLNWSTLNGIDTLGNGLTINPTTSSEYIVTGSDQNGCSNTDTFNITVLDNPIPAISISSPDAVCAGEAVNYESSVTLGGNSPVFEWHVSTDSGATYNQIGTNASTLNYSNFNPGDLVFVNLMSNEHCVAASNASTSSDTVPVNIIPIPDVSLAIPTDVCIGESTFLVSSEANNLSPLNYQWYQDLDGDGEFDAFGNTEDSIEISEAGSYQVAVTYQGLCSHLSNTVSLNVIEVSVLAEISESLISEGQTITLSASTNGDSIVWTNSFGESIYSGGLSDVTHLPETDQTYFISSYIGTCNASSSIDLQVIEPIKVPNAFTPNGDDINDYFTITGLDTYPGARVEIFSRWGNVLYSTYGGEEYTNNPWDGTLNGKKSPSGVYYFTIDLGIGSDTTVEGLQTEPISGSFVLID